MASSRSWLVANTPRAAGARQDPHPTDFWCASRFSRCSTSRRSHVTSHLRTIHHYNPKANTGLAVAVDTGRRVGIMRRETYRSSLGTGKRERAASLCMLEALGEERSDALPRLGWSTLGPSTLLSQPSHSHLNHPSTCPPHTLPRRTRISKPQAQSHSFFLCAFASKPETVNPSSPGGEGGWW